jgi:L-asparaginase II
VATRNGRPDAWHFAAAAVATAEGRLVARLGDPWLDAYPRSCVKPFQAMPLVAAGGCERFSLEAADLAVICGSHSGTAEHLDRVRGLLERGRFDAAALGCAPHPPFDAAAADELRRSGQEPTRLHNNCSGKHAGMLLACRLLGDSTAGPWEPRSTAAARRRRSCRWPRPRAATRPWPTPAPPVSTGPDRRRPSGWSGR